ncbi:MAG: transporter substrate-binding domain-containing protein [Antricoccus sp.]
MKAPSTEIIGDLAPTGVLRAALNLGNPVLAQGTAEAPAGVTVDIARELGARLGVPVMLMCFDAARLSFEAMSANRADICFLAIEPVRAEKLAFTAPYVLIEGVFAFPRECEITALDGVDQSHVSIRVQAGSAYDLFLSRTVQRAHVVRGDEQNAHDQPLTVIAGIGPQLIAFVQQNRAYRLIEEPSMQIRQALGVSRNRNRETISYLSATIDDLKANGFILAALRRSGQDDVTVAPVSGIVG